MVPPALLFPAAGGEASGSCTSGPRGAGRVLMQGGAPPRALLEVVFFHTGETRGWGCLEPPTMFPWQTWGFWAT